MSKVESAEKVLQGIAWCETHSAKVQTIERLIEAVRADERAKIAAEKEKRG